VCASAPTSWYIDDPAPFVPLAMTKRGKEIDYEAKTVMLAGRRYIVCRNHQEAEKDAADRASIVAALERQLAKGDKALIGNTGFRRYLKTISDQHFAIDPDKIEEEKKLDGIFVLRTNTDLNPLEAMLCYKQLWTVEQTFRTAKHGRIRSPCCARAATGQDATAPPSSDMNSRRSFDHLIGTQQDRGRQLDADRLGGLQVDRHHEFRSLLNRQVGRLLALQNFRDVRAGTAVHLRKIDAVGHEAADLDVTFVDEHRRQPVLDRQLADSGLVRNEEGAGQHKHHLRCTRRRPSKYSFEIVRVFKLQPLKLHIQRLRGSLGRAKRLGEQLDLLCS
jgi:hypothetical protein